MKASLLAVTILAAVFSATAQASGWPSDPRICNYGDHIQCVVSTARKAVAAHLGQPAALPAVRCFPLAAAKPLRISCRLGTEGTNYLVVFSKSAGRWWVKVTP